MDSLHSSVLLLLAGAVLGLQPAETIETGRSGWEVRPFTREEGLSQSVVTSILQDQRGRLWLGTLVGLDVYDGLSLNRFLHRPFDQSSLSSPSVQTLMEDSAGRIWIGTDRGINLLDPDSGRLQRFANRASGTVPPGSESINSLASAQGNFIWLGTSGGLELFDPETGARRPFEARLGPEKTLLDSSIFVLLPNDDGSLWVAGLDENVGLLSADRTALNSFPLPRSVGTPEAGWMVEAMTRDEEGVLWLGTNFGLLKCGVESEDLSCHEQPLGDAAATVEIQALRTGEPGELWVGTWGHGLFRLETGSGIAEKIQGAPAVLPDFIRAVTVDLSGLVWVGTHGGGAYKLERSRDVVRSGGNLTRLMVRSLAGGADGEIWVGTTHGLQRYRKEQVSEAEPATPAGERILPDLIIDAVLSHSSSEVWMATPDGLHIFSPSSGNHRVVDNGEFADLFETSTGHVLAAPVGGGLKIFSPSGTAASLPAPTGQRLPETVVVQSLSGREDAVWVGTRRFGVFVLNSDGSVRKQYLHDPADTSSLSLNNVTAIHATKDAVWIGTYGGGLNRFDPTQGSFSLYNDRDGLPSSTLYSIASDRDQRLWMGTNDGLVMLDPEEDVISLFTTADGLPSNEFNLGASLQGPGETLYFGTIKGLVEVAPGNFQPSPYSPPLLLRGRAGNPVGGNVPMAHDGHVCIEVLQGGGPVILQAVSLDFRAPDKNRYAYRSEGARESWVETRRTGEIPVPQFPVGDYDLLLRGSNSDGRWSRQTQGLRIHVRPSWWNLESLSWTLAILAAVGVAIVSVKQVIKRMRLTALAERQQREKLQQALLLEVVGESGEPPPAGYAPGWLRQARRILEKDFLSAPSVQEIAGVVDVHPNYLGSRFKEHFGSSISEFVEKRRLDWAKSRLLESDTSIADIATQAGFSDQSHLTRRFRRRFGFTPGRYRRLKGRLPKPS